MNLNPIENSKEVDEFILSIVDNNLYEHKMLIEYLKQVFQGSKYLYETSLLNISDGGWILILHGEDLLIYGKNWVKKQLEEIIVIIDFKRFKNYGVFGNSELITELLALSIGDDYELEKERVYYKASKINKFDLNYLKIELGNKYDSIELSKMLNHYYQEEYNGLNDKTIEETKERIDSLISSGRIYVLKNTENVILSFCTINNPDIGILFTKKEFRGRGFGKTILSYCSNLLKQYTSEVYLMTDKVKIESNKVSIAVGYVPFFNYKMIKINCC